MRDMNAVEVKDLSYSYTPTEEALKGVNFVVKQGTFVSIIGKNGSGKSTLAKALMGLIKPTHGEIYINGIKLDDSSINEIRKGVCIVFQNPDNQFIGATVEDDIAFGLENRNIPQSEMKKIIVDNATKVHMENYLDKEPTFLSGGQKQRVSIAGALALEPKLLILDEATAMLDPKGKKEVINILKEMEKSRDNLTIISINHEIEEAYLSDVVYVMHKGKIVASGTPNEIFTNEEYISKYHLKKPFILETKEVLEEIEIDIKDANSIDEVVEKICQSK